MFPLKKTFYSALFNLQHPFPQTTTNLLPVREKKKKKKEAGNGNNTKILHYPKSPRFIFAPFNT
jgi:hypothetical protein